MNTCRTRDNCRRLLEACVSAGILQQLPIDAFQMRSGRVFVAKERHVKEAWRMAWEGKIIPVGRGLVVWHEAGTEVPEGWQIDDFEECAESLMNDEEGRNVLLSALAEEGVTPEFRPEARFLGKDLYAYGEWSDKDTYRLDIGDGELKDTEGDTYFLHVEYHADTGRIVREIWYGYDHVPFDEWICVDDKDQAGKDMDAIVADMLETIKENKEKK